MRLFVRFDNSGLITHLFRKPLLRSSFDYLPPPDGSSQHVLLPDTSACIKALTVCIRCQLWVQVAGPLPACNALSRSRSAAENDENDHSSSRSSVQ